jgi:hypothetical protein
MNDIETIKPYRVKFKEGGDGKIFDILKVK